MGIMKKLMITICIFLVKATDLNWDNPDVEKSSQNFEILVGLGLMDLDVML